MKRLLFFPGHRMLAYEWQRGRFLQSYSFEPDEEGRRAFRAWLARAPRAPVQLMLDVIEEEFHTDFIPHVLGRDRRELHRRTAEKHFRQSEFRYLTVQGREPVTREGTVRRDDRVLIAGLTNPQILQGWLSLLEEEQVPLRSIHSLPLVGEQLLPVLGAAKQPRTLVISQQIPSTLRQSYYEDGRLRFSRLVPGRYEDAVGYAEFVQRELRQTLHFLETHRFRRREDPIEVFILCDRTGYEALGTHLSSSETATCHLVPLERLAARAGIRGGEAPTYADTVFAHTLLRQRRPANHYGVPRLRRHFFVQRGRLALQGLSAALLVAAVALAGAWYLRGKVYEEGALEARARTQQFERLYQQRLRQLDAFDHQAVDVKRAVDLLSELDAKRYLHPGGVMAAVGGTLQEHGDIVIERFEWRVVGAETGSRQTALRESGRDGANGLELAQADGPLHAGARLEGTVVGFGGNYRRGVKIFEDFVAALRKSPGLARVEVISAPFDLGTDTSISGDSGTGASGQAAERASFSLIVHGSGDDEAA